MRSCRLYQTPPPPLRLISPCDRYLVYMQGIRDPFRAQEAVYAHCIGHHPACGGIDKAVMFLGGHRVTIGNPAQLVNGVESLRGGALDIRKQRRITPGCQPDIDTYEARSSKHNRKVAVWRRQDSAGF